MEYGEDLMQCKIINERILKNYKSYLKIILQIFNLLFLEEFEIIDMNIKLNTFFFVDT